MHGRAGGRVWPLLGATVCGAALIAGCSSTSTTASSTSAAGTSGLPKSGRAATVTRLLAMTDPTSCADRHPHQLSGGQQQRVALARALAPEPDLLLLDEPFTALDAGLRARVRGEVIDLLRTTGTTAILVTHDPAEALAVADQVSIINAGRIVQTGPPEELHARPATSLAARVLGDTNLLSGTAADGGVSTALGLLELYSVTPAGPVTVMVRPTQILICAGRIPGDLPGPGPASRIPR
jgi:iron(III) transport system ATP-binding protein